MRRKRIALNLNQATGRKNKFRIIVLITAVLVMLFPITVFAAPPVFTQSGPFSVIENSSTGTLVGTVVATGATSYAITAGNGTGGGAFSIDNGGNIRVADGTQLDYETTPQFNLTVAATNSDGTTPATVTINVLNVNDPPKMDQASYDFNVNENEANGTLVGQVSATDNDPADNIIYDIVLATPPGIFSIDSDDGEIRIADTTQIDFETPPADYTIFVRASDGGLADVVPVTITIDDTNDAPVAVDDGPGGPYTGPENTPLMVVVPGVLGNDSDEDVPADTLTAVLDSNAANGNVALNPDGSFTYTPNPQFNGPDSFTYHVNDGSDDSNIATVSLNITGVNDPPTANDDNGGTTDEDSVLNVPATGVLTNDTDPEMDALTVTTFDAASAQGAAVSVNPDGSFSYDPTGVGSLQALAVGDSTTDSFNYTASDGSLSDSATVTITVNGINDAPMITEGISVTVNMDEDGNPTPFSLTLNATDVDMGDTISWSISAGASNGVASATGTGTSKAIGYTPNPSYTGTDSFDVQISDGNGGVDTITVHVNIAPQNDPPDAVDDTPTVNEDSVNNTLDVLANDSILPDTGETLTITAVGATNNGGTAVNNTTDITYTPATNFFGTEVFTYTIGDGNGGFDTATVTVTVLSQNDDPIITEGISTTVNMDEDSTPTAFSLTLNATDIDSSTLTWDIASGAAQGVASASGTGASKAIGYTPNPNYNGTDSFVVRVSDGDGGQDMITVNVNIAPQNDDPDAVDDTPTVNEQSVNNTLNVLGNDTDAPDTGETLTITAVGTPDNGGVVTNTGTAITYTPDSAFIGTEVFTYTIGDGNGGFDTATVTVTVQDVNFPPIITEGISTTVSMDEDGTPTAFSLTLNATDSDGDSPLTWSIASGASHGVASATGNGLSKVIGYTPGANYNGTDSFIVQVSDNNGGTDTIIVNVNIAPQNDPPDAVDDTPTVNEDSVNNTLDVLNNDTDAPDSGETLTITAVGATNNGGTAINNATDITYTPAANFFGTEVFTYTISDGNGMFDTATVTVNVQTQNDDPIITEGISTTVDMDEDGIPTAFALTLNVTDIDSSTFTWSISSGASNGVASASGNGASKAIGYTPNANFNGSDSFVVQVQEEHGGIDTITVNVNIAPINDDPDAVDDSVNTPMDTAVTIDVLANDNDLDMDSLTITNVTNGSNGTVTHNGVNAIYTPTTSYEGPDSFTYTISDGNGGTDTATVNVTVGKRYVYLPMIIKSGPQAPDLVITSLTATNETVEVVVTNQGPVDTGAGFWVDFYVAPTTAPTAANQLWQDLSSEGIAWGITVPIAAGDSLTLTYSTAPGAPNLYYSVEDSNFTGTMSAGTSVYAQVDSAHVSNVNGAILETHEILGGAYNNVSGEVFSTAAGAIPTVVGDTHADSQPMNAIYDLPLR